LGFIMVVVFQFTLIYNEVSEYDESNQLRQNMMTIYSNYILVDIFSVFTILLIRGIVY
jgi:hypothetical protein